MDFSKAERTPPLRDPQGSLSRHRDAGLLCQLVGDLTNVSPPAAVDVSTLSWFSIYDSSGRYRDGGTRQQSGAETRRSDSNNLMINRLQINSFLENQSFDLMQLETTVTKEMYIFQQ